MKLEGMVHCDLAGCEAHQHVGADTMEADRLPMGWVRITEFTNGNDAVLAFDSYDCVLKHYAQFEPTEIVP